MKFSINNRFTGAVQFASDIEYAANAATSIKIGLAVRWAMTTGANLSGADLSGAYLCGADLHSADLRSADLRSADLRSADLCGAYLCGADLCGADLGGQWIVQGATRSDGHGFLLTNLTGEGIRIKAGCRDFTIAQANAHWGSTRAGTPLGSETFEIINGMYALAFYRGLVDANGDLPAVETTMAAE